MRVSTRATLAAGAVVVAVTLTTPAVAVGAGAVARGAIRVMAPTDVVLTATAGGAVDLEMPPHPADMTARQAPEIAATTCLPRKLSGNQATRGRPGDSGLYQRHAVRSLSGRHRRYRGHCGRAQPNGQQGKAG